MSDLSKQLQKQVLSGFNKTDSAPAQLLLHSAALLKLSGSFINFSDSRSIESRFLAVFQLFIRLTHLATWIRHVTMLFLGLINKKKAYFLIAKSLALAQSNSYFRAAFYL